MDGVTASMPQAGSLCMQVIEIWLLTSLKYLHQQTRRRLCRHSCRGSSKYRGVRWHERNGKWEARIFDSNSGKQVSLGYYDSEDAAARAYDAESMRIRGPHAHVNLPLDELPAPARANGRGRRRRASPEGKAFSLVSSTICERRHHVKLTSMP